MQAPETTPPPEPVEDPAEQARFRKRMELIRRIKSGMNWFYWVAGLSIINTVIALTGGAANFFLGFGITQLVDSFITSTAQGALVGAVIDLAFGGLYLLFGYLGQRSHRNWIMVGIALYALDGLIFLYYQVWLGVIFHAYVVYSLVRGLRAMDELGRMSPPAPPVEPTTVSSM